jgi:predicted fused transcriptional regulator/phosphomethylpyrimidine kinase
MMQTYKITQIEFDLNDEDLTTYDVIRINEILQERYIHSEWIVEEEDETSISDLISDECGWGIESIDYRLIRS